MVCGPFELELEENVYVFLLIIIQHDHMSLLLLLVFIFTEENREFLLERLNCIQRKWRVDKRQA